MDFLKKLNIFSNKSIFHQKEEEYCDRLIQKMRTIENGMCSYKKLIHEISKSINGLSILTNQLKDVYSMIIEHSSPFISAKKELIDSSQGITKALENFSLDLESIYKRTSEWEAFFDQLKESISDQNEKKENFLHYSTKIEKFIQEYENNKKVNKEQFERNDEKFKVAAYDYKKSTQFTVKQINDILGRRYDLINPVLVDISKDQINLINKINECSSNIQKAAEILSENYHKNPFIYDTTNYNPIKNSYSKIIICKLLNLRNNLGIIPNKKKENPVDLDNFILKNIHSNRSSFLFPSYNIASEFFEIKDDLD